MERDHGSVEPHGACAMPPLIGDNDARRVLERICARLDGSKSLVIALAGDGPAPDIVRRALAHRLTPRDEIELDLLRRGLDGISRALPC